MHLSSLAACQAATGAPTWSGCSPTFSKLAFERTVCSCDDLRADNTLTTTSGAEVAVNGDLVTSSPLRVASRLTVAGTYTATNTFDADEALLGAGLQLSSPGVVRGDAFVGQILTATNSLQVGGTLHLEQSAEGNGPIVSGATVLGELSAPAPCDCALPLDIPAVVQEASPDGARPAAAFSLGDPSLPQDLDLPCGRVYLDEIVANNTLTLHAVGRTVLFVRGAVRVSGPLRLDLAPGQSSTSPSPAPSSLPTR